MHGTPAATPAGLGPSVPRRGNRFSRALFTALLRLAGWRFVEPFPDQAQAVIVAAPHTSNWDFVVGMSAVFALGVRVHWMGKHTLFRWPAGPLMRWLGGIPIDRTAAHGVVEQTVALFAARPQLLLVVTPEGTRKKVARWKSGFWHIAHGAGVPILLGAIDYRKKQLQVGSLLQPGSDLEADMRRIQAHYAGITPRHRDRF